MESLAVPRITLRAGYGQLASFRSRGDETRLVLGRRMGSDACLGRRQFLACFCGQGHIVSTAQRRFRHEERGNTPAATMIERCCLSRGDHVEYVT